MSNYAFIDSQNLNLAIRGHGWFIYFGRFRLLVNTVNPIYITPKWWFYPYIQTYLGNTRKKLKGKVDEEMVLHAMIEIPNNIKALLVSRDGDFHCLVDYLKRKNKLLHLMIPNRLKYSSLLRKFSKDIVFTIKKHRYGRRDPNETGGYSGWMYPLSE